MMGNQTGLVTTLPELVQRRMRELRFTQTQLAEASGLSQSTVSNVLRLRGKGYTVVTLRRLAIGLGLEIAEVLRAQELGVSLPEELKSIDREWAAVTDELRSHPLEVQRQAMVTVRRLLDRGNA